MEQRYKVGWIVPGRVAGLTHYSPDVTQEDFMGIFAATEQLATELAQDTYFIIDNRNIQQEDLTPLAMMKQAMPVMNSPQIKAIIVIVSPNITELPTEQDDTTTLTHVRTLEEATAYLQTLDNTPEWSKAVDSFFPHR